MQLLVQKLRHFQSILANEVNLANHLLNSSQALLWTVSRSHQQEQGQGWALRFYRESDQSGLGQSGSGQFGTIGSGAIGIRVIRRNRMRANQNGVIGIEAIRGNWNRHKYTGDPLHSRTDLHTVESGIVNTHSRAHLPGCVLKMAAWLGFACGGFTQICNRHAESKFTTAYFVWVH